MPPSFPKQHGSSHAYLRAVLLQEKKKTKIYPQTYEELRFWERAFLAIKSSTVNSSAWCADEADNALKKWKERRDNVVKSQGPHPNERL